MSAANKGDVVGIVGAGRFGSALASVLARAGRPVLLWSRDPSVVETINRDRRSPRLPDVPLPPPLEATGDPRRLASDARLIVMAVSSTNVRERAQELGTYLDGRHLVVHAVGALVPPKHERVSEVMAEGLPTQKIGVIAGPALPADLASGEVASMVIASVFDEVVAEGRRLLNVPPMLRVYGSKDLAGVEVSSALAGAYTLALGLGDGLGVGVGTRAVLVTRIVAEATRLAMASGGTVRTFAGLSGLGNVLVRATERSAEYQLGRKLASGARDGAEIAASEATRAALAATALAKSLRVRAPVLSGIAAVLAGRADPRDAAALIADSVATEE